MQNKKGYIVESTAILLIVVVLLGMIFVSMQVQGVKHVSNVAEIMQAYYAAETGIERTKPYWNNYITPNHAVGDSAEIKEAEGDAGNNSTVQSVVLKYLEVGTDYAVISITAMGSCLGIKEVVIRTLRANFSNGTLTRVNFVSEKNL